MPKRDLFVELMKCFSEFEQYEILRCFFGKGKFIGDNYDSINLKIKLESADEISSLIRKYDTLLKDTKAKEIEQKREILNEMLRLLEPKRNEIISINKKYEVIFYLGNNMNIRHNNQEGKYKNELFLSLEKKDVSLLYDELFYLIKIVVNELSDKNYYRHYELKNDILKKFMDLKEKQNNCDDCSSKS